MKQLYREFLNSIDGERLMAHTARLWNCEFGQTFRDYANAAKYACELMKAEGIPNVETAEFPADGRTTYFDATMPLAWDASLGRLTLLDQDAQKEERIADYARHPFHLVKGSVATPAGGIETRLVTEQDFRNGADVRGAMVLFDAETAATRNSIRPILDKGALGFVADYISARERSMDALPWLNAATDSGSWHVNCRDRPFIGFTVTPRTAERLRAAAKTKTLRLRVESDGRRHEGSFQTITGLIPGRRQEEVWIIAHMYEPLSTDDAMGVAASIECARQIMARGTPEFSVRLVFTMEVYGYLAYIATNNAFRHGRVIGGCNLDSLGGVKGAVFLCKKSGPASPSIGNPLFEALIDEMNDEPLYVSMTKAGSAYFDDICYADPTIGIPLVWVLGRCAGIHHSSLLTMDFIDKETFKRRCAFSAAYLWMLAAPAEKQIATLLDYFSACPERVLESMRNHPVGSPKECFLHLTACERKNLIRLHELFPSPAVERVLADFDRQTKTHAARLAESIPHSPLRDKASRIVPRRATDGFPLDCTRIPIEKKRSLPDGVMYGGFANILANMDGKKDLARLLREAEYEVNSSVGEESVGKYLDGIFYLAEYGYLELAPGISAR